MAIKDIVTRGYGSSNVKYVPTRGYVSDAATLDRGIVQAGQARGLGGGLQHGKVTMRGRKI